MIETIRSFFGFPAHRPACRRELIVNADDLGMSQAVNRGVIAAHERGIVTSASLMVRREAASEAAAYARQTGTLSIGLHVDLGEWIRRDAEWKPLYIVTDLQDGTAVSREVRRQLDAFRDLVGRDPTHLDSHQHVHQAEPVRSVTLELARELDVPLRHFSAVVSYCGRFHGQTRHGEEELENVTVSRLVELLAELGEGITELCCHPADQRQRDEQYGAVRPLELTTLCDPRVRATLAAQRIGLRSFHDVPAAPTVGGRHH